MATNNAQFTSTGKGLTIIGEHCYAYNVLSINNVETDLFSFQTGKEYIVCKWQGGYGESSGNDYEFKLYLNGIEIQALQTNNSTNFDQFPVRLLIPPLSFVELTAYNLDSTTPKQIFASIVGKVYDN